jgi:hypothetical protein
MEGCDRKKRIWYKLVLQQELLWKKSMKEKIVVAAADTRTWRNNLELCLFFFLDY